MSMTDTAERLDVVSAHEVQRVVDRIRLSYPDLELHQIRRIVDSAVRELADARLRQFVPLLVERAAKDECRRQIKAQRRVVRLPDA